MPDPGFDPRRADPRHERPRETRPTSAERVPGSGRTIGGRYRLDRVLGTGSMGTVWAAYDETLHRRVAIKEIYFPEGMPQGEAAALIERTLREARAIAQLSHPNVITLYDILTLAGGPIIVMEVLAARSLGEVLKEVGTLTEGQAATVGVGVAAGLWAAHSAGITHRDVKPGNVLVGGDGRIKLTDFGIARSAAENPMTATGLLLGSPAYIAPEVASGSIAGPPADAWGLGALLFACVEGRPPFDRGNPITTLMSVVTDPLPPLQRAARIAPVIRGLLVKDPQHRLTLPQARAALLPLADDPSEGRLIFRPARSAPGSTAPAWQARTSQDRGSQARTSRAAADAPTEVMRPVRQSTPPHSATPSGSHAYRAGNTAGSAHPGGWRPGPQSTTPSMPPPPWAAGASQQLGPLPAAAAVPAGARVPLHRASHRTRWLIAFAAFLIAAAIAFFGVRAIAAQVQGSALPPATVGMAHSGPSPVAGGPG